MRSESICLISPSHVASNPRLVKEADALYEAGFGVKVIAGDITPGVRSLDDSIVRRAPWPVVKVGIGRRPAHLMRRSRQVFAKKAFAFGLRGIQVAEWAVSPITQSLARAAAAEPAALFIAHYLDGLLAAAWAAGVTAPSSVLMPKTITLAS